ncbi:hypothetical protein [Glycomyces sp. NPDC048151]|uniref:hypothetical protein n=1 Tax=Glycomyces sp. NPDC048151 TaxID=3364002 RepID=UPI00371A21D2
MARTPPEHAVVRETVAPVNWVWAAIGLATLAAVPFVVAAAGNEEITVRNLRSWGPETETYAWAPPLYIAAAILGYAALRIIFMREAVVRTDARGIRLRAKGSPRADWADVDRVVFWDRRIGRRRRTHVGIVRRSERGENFARAAATRTWTAADIRPNGVPDWLPGGIQKHSAALDFRRAPQVAEAVARFAPHVRVTDEREPGRAATVPKPARSRTI